MIGYWDHVGRAEVKVSFERIHFEPGEHAVFEVVEEDGSVHTVPLHRVRSVWRDGELIWHRETRHG